MLTELAARFDLDSRALKRLTEYARRLDTDEAPSTIRGERDVLEKHLADSLVALEHVPELNDPGTTVADLGAGAGLPGLALAAARPVLDVTLVESVAKKCVFLGDVVTALELDGSVAVVPARAEAWANGIGTCDLVVCRALAPLNVLAEYAAPLLKAGGRLVAYKGHVAGDERNAGQRAASELGLDPQNPIPVRPFARAEHRTLHVFTKVAPTPPKFPRREGMARKRPLGA